MGLGDTLERLFSVEQDITLESAIMQFVTAGENISSKTHLPFHKASLAVSFLEKLGEDMDNELSELLPHINKDRGIPMRLHGKLNPEIEKPSKFINEVLTEGMILEPSIDGQSRKELLEAIKFRREEKTKKSNEDSITKLQEWLSR